MHVIKPVISFFVILQSFNLMAQDEVWNPYKSADGAWYLVNENREFLNEVPFDSVVRINYAIKVKRSGLWGLIDFKGKVLTPIEFNSIEITNTYTNRFYTMGKKDPDSNRMLWGILSTSGEEILPAKFREVSIILQHFSNYSLPICFQASLPDSTNSIGLYDVKGTKLIDHKYDKIIAFPVIDRFDNNENFCVVAAKTNGETQTAGAYNVTNQNWVFPCKYDADDVLDRWFIKIGFGKSWKYVPVISERFIGVFESRDDGNSNYDYYSIKGEFLFNTKQFSSPKEEKNKFHFVYEDSIVASSFGREYTLLSDSLQLFQLSMLDSVGNNFCAIFSGKKGIIVQKGIYQFSDLQRINNDQIYLQKLNSMAMTLIDLNGTVVKEIPARKYIGPPDPSKWHERKLEFGSYQYNIKKEKVIIYNLEKKKIKSLSGVVKNNLDDEFDQFLWVENKKRYSIFNLKTGTFVFKKKKKLPKIVMDSLYDYWDDQEALVTYSRNKTPYFQIYTEAIGWAFYNEHGELLKTAPVRALFPMRLLQIKDEFGGVIYHQNGNRRYNYDLGYEMFSGLRLEGLDTVRNIQNNEKGQFLAHDNQGYLHIFDSSGTELIKLMDYPEFVKNDYAIVQLTDGRYTICDTNYNLLFDSSFSNIKGFGKIYVGQKNTNHYLISPQKPFVEGKAYSKIGWRNNVYLQCFNFDGTFDLVDVQGEIMYENCISVEVKYGYFVLKTSEMEYWVSRNLIEYASHATKQKDN